MLAGEGIRGWARSRIIRPQESLVLYKSFNTFWYGISYHERFSSSVECGVCSVADPGCLSRIRIFSIPDPGSKRFPDPHLERILPIPDTGSRGQKGPGSATPGVCLPNNEKLRNLQPAVVAGQPPLQPLSGPFPGHPAPPSDRRPQSYLRCKNYF